MTIESEIRSWGEKLALKKRNGNTRRIHELYSREHQSCTSKYAKNTEIFGHFKRFIELVQTIKKVMVLFRSSWKSIYLIRISSKCFSGEE